MNSWWSASSVFTVWGPIWVTCTFQNPKRIVCGFPLPLSCFRLFQHHCILWSTFDIPHYFAQSLQSRYCRLRHFRGQFFDRECQIRPISGQVESPNCWGADLWPGSPPTADLYAKASRAVNWAETSGSWNPLSHATRWTLTVPKCDSNVSTNFETLVLGVKTNPFSSLVNLRFKKEMESPVPPSTEWLMVNFSFNLGTNRSSQNLRVPV